MSAVIYARISSDPTGQAAGVNRQLTDCRELATRLGVDVLEELIDNDVSATSGARRPGFERAMQLISDGTVDTVIAWHTDRLYRLPRDLEPLVKLADSRPVRFCTVTSSEIDLNTPTGRFVARMLAAVSANETEHKAERQRAANRHRVAQGMQSTAPRQRPFGFEADGIEHRAAEANAIRAAYQSVIGGSSLAAIARRWNDAGFTTSREKPWSSGAVSLVLANERYMGQVTYKREAVGPAVWKAIVDEGTWRTARSLLNVRTGRPGFGRTLLGQLAYCGVCSDGTRVHGGSNNGRRSYRCAGPKQHLSRKAETVEAYIAAMVQARLAQPDAASLLTSSEEDMAPVIAEAEEVRGRLDAMALEFADGTLTASQLRLATDRLRGRLKELESMMVHSSQQVEFRELLATQTAEEAWQALDIDERRRLVDSLMTVTLLPAPRGVKTFDPASVSIEWRQGERAA